MAAKSIARSSRMNASDVDDAVQEALVRLWRTGNRLYDCQNVESTRDMMEVLISRLPTTQQKLIRMRGEGMTLDEIAAIVQMPKTSVKTLIARARRELLSHIKLI